MRTASRSKILAALLVTVFLALPAGPAAAQMNEQSRRDMGLTVEPLDLILRDLQAFDFKDVGPLMRLRAAVFARKDDPRAKEETEAALLKFVQGSPAPGGLMAACRALRLIGGPGAVPVLAALVLEAGTTGPARYALERIPGSEADQALLAALDKTAADVRRGVVFSIGERESAAAVPALAKLAGGTDAALAADAVKALGKTGGAEAIKALTAMLGKSSPALKSEAASALLLAAEMAIQSGDKAAAASIYDKVFAAAVTPVLRQAAFEGRIAAAADPRDMVLKALAGQETLLYAPALVAVPAHFPGADVAGVAGLMDRLPVENRIQLTALLAGYPAAIATPYLQAAADSPSADVRRAALRALAAAGDGESAAFLAAKAARTAGAEQDAAREALDRMKGLDVDAAVLEQLGRTADEGTKAELVRTAGERRIAAAKPALMETVKAGAPALRSRAAAALRAVCAQGDLPALLDLLAGLDDEQARETMEDTVAAVARANPRELARAGEAMARLAAVNDSQDRADLLRVLGKIGDDSALPQVREALGDADGAVVDAAVRALADWPTIAARDDVLGIARTATSLNHKVLAARAFVRMVGLEPYRAPEAATADLAKVLALAPRPEEQKLVLGLLGRFPCPDALKIAESLAADPAVAAEAKLAAERIRGSLK